MNNLHRELAPISDGRLGADRRRKHRARSSVTSPAGAWWT